MEHETGFVQCEPSRSTQPGGTSRLARISDRDFPVILDEIRRQNAAEFGDGTDGPE